MEGRVHPEVLILAERPESWHALSEGLARRGYNVSIARWGGDSCAAGVRESLASLVLVLVDDMAKVSHEDIAALAGKVPGRRSVAVVGPGEIGDRVRMLNAGADMCLPVGLSDREMIARLTALLRRASLQGDRPTLQEGQLTVDLVRRAAAYRGRRLNLSSYEYRILRDLALRVMECRSRFPTAGDDRLTNALRRLNDYAEGLEERSRTRMATMAVAPGESLERRPD